MRRLTAGLALGACAPEKKTRAIWLNAPLVFEAAGSSGAAVCVAEGVMAWEGGAAAGERGRGGRSMLALLSVLRGHSTPSGLM